jgi:hypothetical protein
MHVSTTCQHTLHVCATRINMKAGVQAICPVYCCLSITDTNLVYKSCSFKVIRYNYQIKKLTLFTQVKLALLICIQCNQTNRQKQRKSGPPEGETTQNRVETGQRTTRNLTQPHIHITVTHNLYPQCTEIRDLVCQYIVVI